MSEKKDAKKEGGDAAADDSPSIIGDGKTRLFVFDDRQWEDPGDTFSDDDMLGMVASQIPALAGGKITREDKGDYVEVIFEKKPKKLG